MNLIYNKNNQLSLSNIIDGYEIPQKYKAKLAECFKYVYERISETFKDSNTYKQSMVDKLNTIVYLIISGDAFLEYWNNLRPFEQLPEISDDIMHEVLQKIYLTVEGINWDVDPSFKHSNERHQTTIVTSNKILNQYKKPVYEKQLQQQNVSQVSAVGQLTSMDDVLLDPGFPYVPAVDMNNPWLYTVKDNEKFAIYTSLPIVPKCQADITVSTEVNSLIPSELLCLYPNHVMKLRHQSMYTFHAGYNELEWDDDLGIIFPIEGFTRAQVIDNIIKYPDIINIGPGRIGKRSRSATDSIKETIWEPFEYRMEINHELVKVNGSTWNDIPELRPIPPTAAFRQEYVVRKYLLERDNGIHHEKEMFGTLYPFITLFMPMEGYISRGYTAVEDIALKCVKSRVSYHRSRNPMLLKLGLHYNYEGELIN